ncbi:MAG: hypothetical protein LW832_08480 [Parachlamydia sp.]|jgi:hypothetical protein|nr:hypothetical protein [Parachlamydia sp.]
MRLVRYVSSGKFLDRFKSNAAEALKYLSEGFNWYSFEKAKSLLNGKIEYEGAVS